MAERILKLLGFGRRNSDKNDDLEAPEDVEEVIVEKYGSFRKNPVDFSCYSFINVNVLMSIFYYST